MVGLESLPYHVHQVMVGPGSPPSLGLLGSGRSGVHPSLGTPGDHGSGAPPSSGISDDGRSWVPPSLGTLGDSGPGPPPLGTWGDGGFGGPSFIGDTG